MIVSDEVVVVGISVLFPSEDMSCFFASCEIFLKS